MHSLWKAILPALFSTAWAAPTFVAEVGEPMNVLVLMPSLAYLRLEDGSMVLVGSYISETMIPTMEMIDRGYKLTFATPQGTKPPLDESANSAMYFDNEAQWERAKELWASFPPLQTPLKLSDLAPEDPFAAANVTNPILSTFDGLFIPGGHAPMIDLWVSTSVGRILTFFVDQQRPIAAVCHAPLILAAAALVRQPWDFKGKNITVFAKDEEIYWETNVAGGRKLGYYPEEVLAKLGANMIQQKQMFVSHVVVDGLLVTGQNPQSATALSSAFIELLSQPVKKAAVLAA